MSNFTDFIGGGGGSLFTVPITKSVTWTPPFNGTGVIHVIGAGGSGANFYHSSGAAGGYSKKAVTFATGTNWTLVVGAGGAAVNATYGGSPVNGNTGGTSSATDGSSTLTANGGVGGQTGSVAAGGTASGGDVNNAGGTGSQNLVTGGGAVGILGTGNSVNSSSDAKGADSDIIGPYNPNAYGVLSGGGSGGFVTSVQQSGMYQSQPAGFLAGGGATFVNNTDGNYGKGQDGGIGGGGGSIKFGYPNSTWSGSGGNVYILIQYLTVS